MNIVLAGFMGTGKTAVGQAHVSALLSQRAPFYAKADYTVDTDGLTVSEVADKIVSHKRFSNFSGVIARARSARSNLKGSPTED